MILTEAQRLNKFLTRLQTHFKDWDISIEEAFQGNLKYIVVRMQKNDIYHVVASKMDTSYEYILTSSFYWHCASYMKIKDPIVSTKAGAASDG